MRLYDVLGVFGAEEEKYLESISYDGSDDCYKVGFCYTDDEVDKYYLFSIILFDGGESAVEMSKESDWSYVPSEVFDYIHQIIKVWKDFWKSKEV